MLRNVCVSRLEGMWDPDRTTRLGPWKDFDFDPKYKEGVWATGDGMASGSMDTGVFPDTYL